MEDSSASVPGASRTTRSQSTAAQHHQQAASTTKRAASPILIDDSDGDDEEEAFEYESDAESPHVAHSDHGMEVDELDEHPTAACIVLSSDGEDDEHPHTPPEPRNAAPKGKLSSRKQFQADVAHLAERFNLGTNELIRGTSLSAFGAGGALVVRPS